MSLHFIKLKSFTALPFRAENRRSLRNKPTFNSAVQFACQDRIFASTVSLCRRRGWSEIRELF